jgi:hypothetical protein
MGSARVVAGLANALTRLTQPSFTPDWQSCRGFWAWRSNRACVGGVPPKVPSARRLQWPISPRHHIDRNRGLGDLDAELEQLAMDLGGAPDRVLKAHSSDQVTHLFGDPRSATGRARLPSPVSGETHSMPTQDGLGPDDGYGVKDARAATIEPSEQSTIGPT